MALSADENDLMCRVNPGSAMGAMLREYWWPVLRSQKLVPDGPPERVRLLGEDFVAFRDTDGRLGFLDEGCPHRHVSLALARNENCGLRCVMHGWKIDVEGNVVDTPNEFGFSRPERIKTHHYPIREAGGMIWVWVGAGEPSPFPNYAFNDCEPETQVLPVMAKFRCNWVQLMETVWDPAHVGILHGTGESVAKAFEGHRSTSLEVTRESGDSPLALGDCSLKDMPWGFMYHFAGQTGPAARSWVATVMPCWIYIGAHGDTPDTERLVFGHVPIDDENTIFWHIVYNPSQPLGSVGQLLAKSDDPDDWRPRDMSRDNNWEQDRDAMNHGSFTGIGEGRGIAGVLMQDVATAESMGPLVDRRFENLGPADRAVIKGRRMLLAAVRTHMDGAPALGVGEDMSNVGRAGGVEHDLEETNVPV